MVGAPVAGPRSLAATVTRYHLGGVFLAGRSTRTAAALRSDITALQRAAGSLPLLVALDQEGGDVQTLKGPDFPLIPSAVTQGTWSASTLRARTAAEAKELAAIGVNLNLSPVADTVPASIGRANPPIGAFKRQFGSTPGTVAAAIRTVVPASQGAGVLTTLKHFPGLGRVEGNTDNTAAVIDDVTTIHDPYLGSFAGAIDAGTEFVMISLATYTKIDPDHLAAFSPTIMGELLRTRLGFGGVIMSDTLSATAVINLTPAVRAVRFLEAGGDMIVLNPLSTAITMAKAVLYRTTVNAAFKARVDDAALRILEAKGDAGLLPCG
jgi:beta-N-acetylhexosaminidase